MPAAGEPIYIADILKAIRASSERPMVRCLATATQSIPDATMTALQFGAEDWDLPGGMHDPVTNNSRITAVTAGYYLVRGTYFTGPRTDYVNVDVSVRKNGATSLAPAERRSYSTAATQVSTAMSVQCSLQVQLAAGEYVELMAFQDNAANAAQITNQSARFSSCFEAELLRYL